MPKTAIVTRDDPSRPDIEAFIKKVYRLRYNASVDDFPAQLIAFRGDNDELLCAAGLRTAEDGFFSENYLDAPIEKILGDLSSQAVPREEIVEVSTLVSLAPNEVSQFIADMISFGKANGFSWSFFTATARLRRIVEKLGLCADLSRRCRPSAHRELRAVGKLLRGEAARLRDHQPATRCPAFRSAPTGAPCDLCLTPWSATRGRTAQPSR